jgi:predicted MFS family arabinose efflux permease
MLSAGALAVIGGASAIGSLATGWLGSKYPRHILLGLIYMLRSVLLAAYFVLPPTPASTLLFAAVMGMLWWPGLIPLIVPKFVSPSSRARKDLCAEGVTESFTMSANNPPLAGLVTGKTDPCDRLSSTSTPFPPSPISALFRSSV